MAHQAHNTVALARRPAREAEARASACRSWATIALQRLYRNKPLDQSARDVLQTMAAAIACEAEAALEASDQLTTALGRRGMTKEQTLEQSSRLMSLLTVCEHCADYIEGGLGDAYKDKAAWALSKVLALASELAGKIHDEIEVKRIS
jgi:hypothetical protein